MNGPDMHYHGLVLVTHLGPAQAGIAAAIAAVITVGGLGWQRLHRARSHA